MNKQLFYLLLAGVICFLIFRNLRSRTKKTTDPPSEEKGIPDKLDCGKSLKKGSRGEEVRNLQAQLNTYPLYVNPILELDAAFGPLTQAALEEVSKAIDGRKRSSISLNEWSALSGKPKLC